MTAPRPTTSSRVPSRTTAAVSSSIPMPSSDGDWATSDSSRPYRLRCSKCWSITTPRQQAEAGGQLTHPLLRGGAAAPKAIMWSARMLAPAEVPPTTTPRWYAA